VTKRVISFPNKKKKPRDQSPGRERDEKLGIRPETDVKKPKKVRRTSKKLGTGLTREHHWRRAMTGKKSGAETLTRDSVGKNRKCQRQKTKPPCLGQENAQGGIGLERGTRSLSLRRTEHEYHPPRASQLRVEKKRGEKVTLERASRRPVKFLASLVGRPTWHVAAGRRGEWSLVEVHPRLSPNSSLQRKAHRR